MKNTLTAIITLGLFASPAFGDGMHSNHQPSKASVYAPYIKGNIGLPIVKKAKNGFEDSLRFMPHGTLALGAKHKNIALELEAGYLSFKTKSSLKPLGTTAKSALKSKTLFLNALFYPQVLRYSSIKPYVGVGIGAAFNNTGNKYTYINNSQQLIATGLKHNNFGFQVIAGAEHKLNNTISLLADVRYIYLGKFKQQDVITQITEVEKLPLVSIMLGIKYKL